MRKWKEETVTADGDEQPEYEEKKIPKIELIQCDQEVVQ